MGKITLKDKTYSVIDNDTGEVVATDARFYGHNPYIDTKFRKVFIGFLSDVVMNKRIAGKAIRLLLWMIENLKINDLEVYMSERTVCNELGISRITYFRWLKALIEEKLIEKIDTNLYRLIPYTAVNGQMEKAIRKGNHKREKREKKEREKDPFPATRTRNP